MLGALAAAALTLLFVAPALAVPTASFELGTFKDLNAGTPRGTLVLDHGEVIVGPDKLKLEAPKTMMFWSRAFGSDGRLYLGGGQPGKVFVVDGQKVRAVADLGAVLVSALSPGPGGSLLAATLPDARVISLNPQSGKWKELARLPARHIWDLLYDKEAGRIVVGTGSPGKIYTLPAGGGKPSQLFDAKEEHILSLALAADSAVLACGVKSGILYRVAKNGRVTAVHDFDANELKRVVIGADGAIYVAVNQFQARTAGLPRYDREEKGEGGTKVEIKAKKGAKKEKVRAAELRPGAKSGKGAVYRISAKGELVQLHALTDGYFTDLALDEKGVLWAADGAKGRVFRVAGRRVSLAFDVKERQVLSLAFKGKEKVFGTGDSGAVYRIVPRPRGKAAYLTKVLDANTPARWGNVRYRATAALKVYSRSGNTAKPDYTWHLWRPASVRGTQLVRVESEPARYLQLKFEWQKSAGALRSVEAYYRPQNRPGRVEEISFARKEQNKKPTRTIKIKWKVDNPDKDKLVYRLFFREELGVTWRALNEGKPIEKTEYEWDTESVADDTYRVRVVASDEEANGPGTLRKHALISAPLVIDNRPPDVTGLAVRYPFVSGMAQDSATRITRIEYSLDGGEWRLLDAADGIYDSIVESFRFTLPALKKRGTHTVAVRVTDDGANIGVRRLRFVYR